MPLSSIPVRETPESLTYGGLLPAVYRFALLMTGSVPTAAEVLRLTVEQAERGDLSDVRDPRRVRRWLFARARSLCSRPLVMPEALVAPSGSFVDAPSLVPGLPDDSVHHLPLLFARLPEPERCALALFYLYVFAPDELAEALDVKPAALAELLTRGRSLLSKAESRSVSTSLQATATHQAEAEP